MLRPQEILILTPALVFHFGDQHPFEVTFHLASVKPFPKGFPPALTFLFPGRWAQWEFSPSLNARWANQHTCLHHTANMLQSCLKPPSPEEALPPNSSHLSIYPQELRKILSPHPPHGLLRPSSEPPLTPATSLSSPWLALALLVREACHQIVKDPRITYKYFMKNICCGNARLLVSTVPHLSILIGPGKRAHNWCLEMGMKLA